MQWAIAFHPDQIARGPNGRWRLLQPPIQIAEACLPAARGQGWIVLGTDSDVCAAASVDVNLHSNPRRQLDEEDQA